MHNFLKSKDEESIGRLLHIIELGVVVHGKQINRNVATISDDNINQIEGLELSCDAIRQEIIQYFGKQHNIS
jgi:hypothetical protein